MIIPIMNTITPATPKNENILNFSIFLIKVSGNTTRPVTTTIKKSDKKKLSKMV
jgi:hypothetical protein